MTTHKNPSICLTLVGPTASGKSEFALAVAHRLGAEIICLDSTTVYKGFDIGSSKPSERDRSLIPHHLLDILEPLAPFSAGKFVALAEKKMEEVEAKGKLPLIVGGTYFYLRALQYGMYDVPETPPELVESIEQEFTTDDGIDLKRLYEELSKVDPVSAKALHPNDQYRLLRALTVFRATGKSVSEAKVVKKIPSSRLWMKYALLLPRSEIVDRIRKRTDEMLVQGLVEETRKLNEAYPGARALQSIGYKESLEFLNKKITEKDLRSDIQEKTRQLAKRQMTWLRSDHEMRFIDSGDTDRVLLEVENMKTVLQ